jgi:hypothetical protein
MKQRCSVPAISSAYNSHSSVASLSKFVQLVAGRNVVLPVVPDIATVLTYNDQMVPKAPLTATAPKCNTLVPTH